jgi:hypothetical protein
MSLRDLLTSESSDKQLKELANRLCLRLDGIVFKSELSKIPTPSEKRNYNYIVHLEQPQHWTALFIDNRNKRAYWFNSFSDYFGEVPQDVLDFIKRSHCILYESDKPIQDPNYGQCGSFSILWLYYMNRPTNDLKDFNDYLKLFKSTEKDIKKYKENNPELMH